MGCHTQNFFVILWPFQWLFALNGFLYVGFLGVDIFFVISGFLITGLLYGEVKSQIRVKKFYTRRFFKIIPQYVMLLLVCLVFLRPPIQQFIPQIFFLQNYFPGVFSLGHTWSLAIEEHFYFIYLLILYLICWVAKDVQYRNQLIIGVLLTLIICANVARWQGLPPGYFSYFNQMTHFRIDALSAGCLLRLLYEKWGRNKILQSLAGLFCVGGIIIYFYIILCFQQLEWFHYTLAYLGAGLLISSCLWKCEPMETAMGNPLLRWIGRNSYGIYLWHYVLFYLSPIRQQNNAKFIILYVFLAIMIGALSTITIERFFLNLRKRYCP